MASIRSQQSDFQNIKVSFLEQLSEFLKFELPGVDSSTLDLLIAERASNVNTPRPSNEVAKSTESVEVDSGETDRAKTDRAKTDRAETERPETADIGAMDKLDTLMEFWSMFESPRFSGEIGGQLSDYGDSRSLSARATESEPTDQSNSPSFERLEGAEALTPGSDLSFGFRDEFLNWGRIGNDVLISYKPSNSPLGEDARNIDLMLGDIADEQLFPDSFDESERITPLQWSDTFVLGDWNQPYYVNRDRRADLGFNEFAIIGDFVPDFDKIRLHGSAEDYTLETISLLGVSFQVLSYKKLSSPINPNQSPAEVTDAVALIGNIFGTAGETLPALSLTEDYFEYVGTDSPHSAGFNTFLQIGTEGIDLSFGAETDSAGNLYIAGATDGAIDGETGEGSYDVWLAKYDADGHQVWIQKFGTGLSDLAFGLTVDDTSAYLTGVTNGSLAGENAGGQDIWLGRFDGTTGEAVWINQFGDTGVDASQGIDVDADGNVYISGLQTKPTPPNTADFPLTDDSFVAKFNGDDGNLIFQTAFGTEPVPGNAAFDESYDVAVGTDGSLFASGWTLSNLENPGSSGTKSENGLYDVWVSRFDEAGNQLWLQQIGTPAYEFLWDIEVDGDNNAYVSGWTLGDFDGEGNAGSFDVWLSKFDADGQQLWTEQFGTSGDDGSYLGGMAVSEAGDIFMTGYTRDAFVGNNAGLTDVWVSRFNTDGEQQWIQQFGTASDDFSTDISISDDGTLFVTGHTEGSFNDSLNQGSFDSWVAKLSGDDGSVLPFATPSGSGEDFLIGDMGDNIPSDEVGKDVLLSGSSNSGSSNSGQGAIASSVGEQSDIFALAPGEDMNSMSFSDDLIYGQISAAQAEADVLISSGYGSSESSTFDALHWFNDVMT